MSQGPRRGEAGGAAACGATRRPESDEAGGAKVGDGPGGQRCWTPPEAGDTGNAAREPGFETPRGRGGAPRNTQTLQPRPLTSRCPTLPRGPLTAPMTRGTPSSRHRLLHSRASWSSWEMQARLWASALCPLLSWGCPVSPPHSQSPSLPEDSGGDALASRRPRAQPADHRVRAPLRGHGTAGRGGPGGSRDPSEKAGGS